MSRRPGFVADHRQPADGGVSPNQYHALISVQVRCNWPPLATRAEIEHALAQGYALALASLDDDTRYRP